MRYEFYQAADQTICKLTSDPGSGSSQFGCQPTATWKSAANLRGLAYKSNGVSFQIGWTPKSPLIAEAAAAAAAVAAFLLQTSLRAN